MDNVDDTRLDLRHLQRQLFERVKQRWVASMALKLIIALANLTVILTSNLYYNYTSAVVSFLLLISSEVLMWLSDQDKKVAEGLLQKLDERDSFGIPVSSENIADLITSLPNKWIRQAHTTQEQYFASTEDAGPKKALENVEESAWWSSKLAGRMASYFTVLCAALFVLIFLLLLVVIEVSNSAADQIVVARIGIVAISLLATLGIARLTTGYYSIAKSSAQIAEESKRIRESNNFTERQAYNLWSKYQLARYSAPFLPSWLWRGMQKGLEAGWKQRNA